MGSSGSNMMPLFRSWILLPERYLFFEYIISGYLISKVDEQFTGKIKWVKNFALEQMVTKTMTRRLFILSVLLSLYPCLSEKYGYTCVLFQVEFFPIKLIDKKRKILFQHVVRPGRQEDRGNAPSC